MASKTIPPMNPWEAHALNYALPPQSLYPPVAALALPPATPDARDSLIYPGLYSGTGFDLMAVLLQVQGRPSPLINIGPVDCSVAIIVCDLEVPDTPIVYASDSFCELTGYSKHEVLGQNCRFLQNPSAGSVATQNATAAVDTAATLKMRQAIEGQQEIQVRVDNYRKNGQRFTNILSIIPVQSAGHRYAVGFCCDANA